MWFEFFSFNPLSPPTNGPFLLALYHHISHILLGAPPRSPQLSADHLCSHSAIPPAKQSDQINSYTCVTDHLMSHQPPLKQLLFFFKVIYALKLKRSNCRLSKNGSAKKVGCVKERHCGGGGGSGGRGRVRAT